VLLLGTGTTGLALASTPQWSTSVFTGVVLIVALAVTSGRVGMPKRLRRRAAVAA
jgi:ribose transport system permease protein